MVEEVLQLPQTFNQDLEMQTYISIVKDNAGMFPDFDTNIISFEFINHDPILLVVHFVGDEPGEELLDGCNEAFRKVSFLFPD